MPGKMIGGELMLATSTQDGYIIFSLGNPDMARTPFAINTVRVNRSGWGTPYRNMAIHASGEKAWIGQGATPWIRQLDLTTGAYLANPASLPAQQPEALVLSPTEDELYVALAVNPWMLRYRLSDLVQLAAPSTPPTGIGGRASYSPDGTWLAVPHSVTPFLSVYRRSDMAKLADPAALPATRRIVGDFNPASTRYACGGSSGGTSVFDLYDTTTTPWTRIATPAFNVATVRGVRFSPDGTKIAVITSNAASTTTLYLYDVAANTMTARTLGATVAGYLTAGSDVYWLDNDRVIIIAEPGGTAPGSVVIPIFNMTTNSVETTLQTGISQMYGAIPLLATTARRRLAGTVKTAGAAPLARTVRAHHRVTGRRVGETISSAVDGTFEMIVYTTEPVIVTAVGSGTEVTKLYDSIAPVV